MRAVRGWWLFLLMVGTACAGGPRWVTGPPYFSNSGNPVVWNTKSVQYWTDPGDLSGAVNHAAADAMVAKAASVWNVSVSSMTVSQGGVLAEDVSGSNAYLGSTGPVFPADVQVGNAGAIPVAVIYDADGAVTDMLLGGGASDPGNCRQAAVTESVDGISAAGKITHALLVLNGRCAGAAPEMQNEMTYRLVRAFGRILGVGWSQLNDNMFTGVPVATYAQAMHWPVMHPIDVLCGPYAYQCMPQPFTLRPDDVATMVMLYPEGGSDAGKTSSFVKALPISGVLSFPNGQGMRGVNIVARRRNMSANTTDQFDEVSGVTGYRFQQMGASPVAGKGTSLAVSQGAVAGSWEGQYFLPWVPIDTTTYWQMVIMRTEAVNPLYTGQYAVGPYGSGSQVLPSGPVVDAVTNWVGPGSFAETLNLAAPGAMATCTATGDGTAAGPGSVDPSGLWQTALCGYAHTAWKAVTVKAGRTLTVEVTAVDEQGMATNGKMQPVFGVWASTDATTVLPTVASASSAMNTATLGMTAATISNAATRTLRLGIGDQRGDGRPDYGYKARVLYADSVTPTTLPSNGGSITIAGMGFRNGNAVLVNGVAAQVMSWSANAIVAVAPAMTGAVTADVTVLDVSTAGQTTVSGALTYSGTSLPDGVSIVSVPADGSALGVAAVTVFGVKVLLADGVSPAAGVAVDVSATNGAGMVGCGGASSCSLTTDGAGMVRTAVVPFSGGTVGLGATVATVTATAWFMAGSRAADGLRVISLPMGTVFAGIPASLPWTVQVLLGDGVTPDAGAQVTLTAQGAGLGGCGGASSCVLTADAMGMVATTLTPVAAGVVSLTARAGSGTVVASFGVVAMPADVLQVVSAPASGSVVGSPAGAAFQVQVLLGDGVTPAAGAAVTLSTGGAAFGGCGGASSCVLTADGTGRMTTAVTPGVVGQVMLSAAAGGGLVQTGFTAVAVSPNRLELVSVPANGNLVGAASGLPFSVRVFLSDGVTPVMGLGVTLTATGGTFVACGLPVCVVATDAAGWAGSSVTPAAAGTVGLTAEVSGLSVSNSFTVVADKLRVVSFPLGQAYVGVPTRSPLVLQVLGLDGVTPVAGISVTVRLASLGTLEACGAATCVMTADAQGMVSTLVTPMVKGAASIEASAGGGTMSTAFGVVTMPPDILRIVAAPSVSVYTGLVAQTPLTFLVLLGDGVHVHAGTQISIFMTNATLPSAGCGGSCNRFTDSNGMFTTTVLPQRDGLVTLAGLIRYTPVSTTFMSLPLPPDVLTVVSAPGDGAVPGKVASTAFSVQAMLGDQRTVAGNVQVTMTATGATLGCGLATCFVGSNAQGVASVTVKPTGPGRVVLTATAGGGNVTATFLSVTPPDVLQVLSVPANGVLAGQAAVQVLKVKVLLADGVTMAMGASVTLTAAGGTLGVCGLSSCVVTVGPAGMVSTTVTPTVVGLVGLTATAGGGSVSASFTAAAPPDTLAVVSVPGNGAYVGRAAAAPFMVKVLLWDGSASGGAAVTLTASNGTLGACGLASCVVTADGAGMVSATVTPVAAGLVGLTAAAGGGTVSASFTASAVPPDVLTVVSVPANGSYVGRAATASFAVRVVLGDGGVGAGAVVTVTAANALLGACGAASCVLTADAAGAVSTTVAPVAAGVIGLTALAGGGTVSTSFTAAVVPPDALTVVSTPANGGYAGSVAGGVFQVRVMLGDGAVGVGAAVTLTVSGGTLGVCGAAVCVVTADGSGRVASTVTPGFVGVVELTASAGGGTASGSFMSVATPADLLTVVSVPAGGGFVGDVAAGSWRVKVMLGDGATAASGVRVTLTAVGGTLGVCGAATCVVTADALGMVATAVTPAVAGVVGLRATAGGGVATASFGAVDHVRGITMVQAVEYVAAGARVVWTPRVLVTMDGAPLPTDVRWTGGTGMVVGDSSASSDTVLIGPLGVGGEASGQACGWGTVCASFGAVVVDQAEWGIVMVRGGGQAVGVGGGVDPVVARVVDASGHGIAGAVVSVHQRANGYVSCPATGRCPVGPVVGLAGSNVVSDVDGLVAVMPLIVSGTGETTGVVFTAGENGFLATSVSLVP